MLLQRRVISSLFNGSLKHYINVYKEVPCVVLVVRNFRSYNNWNVQPNLCFIKTLPSLSITTRNYAKSKDIKKSKGKRKVEINPEELAEVLNVAHLEAAMQLSIQTLKEEFVKNLSLRSTTGAIDALPVHFDGKQFMLQELAQIIKKNPKLIVVKMINFPQAIPDVLKALDKSGMNLNPQQDGTSLFIPVPKVTKEHRESLAKNAKALFIKCKDAIKDIQNKNIRNVKKQDNISSDLSHNIQQQIVIIADKYVAEAESILELKQNELLRK